MRFALLLLWLTTLAPAARLDWLTWRRVAGDLQGRSPSHSQLPQQYRYDDPQQIEARYITGATSIAKALVSNRKPVAGAGILRQEPRSGGYACCKDPGGRRAGSINWRSWFAAARPVSPGTAPAPRRPQHPARPAPVAAFSARFLAIWQIRAPLIPNCRGS
ncbi:hypothetical protein MJ563_03595 [Klebsiella pneumoniae]|nr:hypothetical protein MJ563_03595 [Klebsiella pneumoniae]